MPDVFSKNKRSEVMSKIRSHGNTNTEIRAIKLFRKYSISGWRRRQKVFGKPDFVFRKSKVAVFIDGCFWHVCPIHGHFPLSKKNYWVPKLKRNVERDKFVSRKLRKDGWKVIRVWECALKSAKKPSFIKRLTRDVGR